MGVFESYLEEFSQSVNLTEFLLNMGVTAILCILLRLYYIRFANAVSNRARFASIFLLLGLSTMLIITIVKSSIALSLGLVGALSIVRFRAAIKDPEELTYLFLVIGIGLAAGANQPLIALLAFVVILGILYLTQLLSGRIAIKQEDQIYFNIRTDLKEITPVVELLKANLSYVELKRMDSTDLGLDLSFVIKVQGIEQLEIVQKQLQALSPATSFSLVDQPDLVI